MTVRITTLSENKAAFGCLGEWGLSLLVEAGSERVLLDSGMGLALPHNVEQLEVNLTGLDAVVLSHGHIDHTGGLAAVLERSGPVRVIAHPQVWETKYSTRKGPPYPEIGMPFPREDLERLGASFELSREPVWVTPRVVTSGEVPMTCPFETVDEGLLRAGAQGPEPDPLADDLALAVRTQSGLVVVLGCAHRGPVNTVERLRQVTGEQRVRAVVGGTHLVRASEERIRATIHRFREWGVETVACSHCTGYRAEAMMVAAFGEAFVRGSAGTVLEFEVR